MRFVESLNNTLDFLLSKDDRVYIIGEDLEDPYGGAFKVTKGLSTAYPGRIISTPISEATIVGMGTGMAMKGLLPVVEIMFGDFIALAFDQILNHATKFELMYNGQVNVPLTIRTPMGGGRSYGPTHSQSLEKFFFGIPGIKVIAPSIYNELTPLLEQVVFHENSMTLVIEHKLLYPMQMEQPKKNFIGDFMVEISHEGGYPVIKMSLVPLKQCQVTILAYGYVATLAKEAAYELIMNEDIGCHLVIPTLLSPFNYNSLLESIRKTGRLLIAEEGTMRNGFGAEISSVVSERLHGELKNSIRRVASSDTIVPSARNLESDMLISKEKIIQAVLSQLH